MAEHIHPVDIPARFYKPIGQIIAGWNLTEALISSIIWHVHGITDPKVGRLFTYRPNSVEKLKIFLLSAQNHVTDFALRGSLCRMYGVANRIRIERNNIAHGLWGRMPKEHSRWKVFYSREVDDKNKSLLRRERKSLKDLTNLAARVKKLNIDLMALMNKNNIPPP